MAIYLSFQEKNGPLSGVYTAANGEMKVFLANPSVGDQRVTMVDTGEKGSVTINHSGERVDLAGPYGDFFNDVQTGQTSGRIYKARFFKDHG